MKKITIIKGQVIYSGGGNEEVEEKIYHHCHLGVGDEKNHFEELVCELLTSCLNWNSPELSVVDIKKTGENKGYILLKLNKDGKLLDAKMEIKGIEITTFGEED